MLLVCKLNDCSSEGSEPRLSLRFPLFGSFKPSRFPWFGSFKPSRIAQFGSSKSINVIGYLEIKPMSESCSFRHILWLYEGNAAKYNRRNRCVFMSRPLAVVWPSNVTEDGREEHISIFKRRVSVKTEHPSGVGIWTKTLQVSIHMRSWQAPETNWIVT